MKKANIINLMQEEIMRKRAGIKKVKKNLSRIDKKDLKSSVLTVDGIILKNGKILLVKRTIYPFSGYWVLPGGHVKYREKVEEAIKREIKEELGISVNIKKLFGVYSDPRRDPRYHAVSLVYICQPTRKPQDKKIKLNFEASKFKYFSLKDLPKKIGFDHRKIINNLIKRNEFHE